MKIEICKVDGKSRILLDGQPVEAGCIGFEITSSGAGYSKVSLTFLAKDLEFTAEVDDPIAQAPGTSKWTRRLK